jgi:hypothetical protein
MRALPVKMLSAAVIAVALTLPPAAAAEAGSLFQRGHRLGPDVGLDFHHPRHGLHLRDRDLGPGAQFRQDLFSHLRHRVYGASKVATLDRRAFSGRHPHKVITLEEHAFIPLHKGGIFNRRSETIILLQPHRLPRHGDDGVPSAPRKIIGHGGHGLFAHRSELFGGGLVEHNLSPAHRPPPGAHPRNILVPLSHD